MKGKSGLLDIIVFTIMMKPVKGDIYHERSNQCWY